MAYRCTAIKMSPGGHLHSHIVEIRAIDESSGGTIVGSRQQWVDAVKGGARAYVLDKFGDKAYLRVNRMGYTEYVQTYADGIWTDNLLALPRY